MSQITPKNKDTGQTNSQESPPNASKKNNQTNPNEESKDPAQNQKKGWSLGSWFKKPKASPSNDTTKDDSTHSTEEEIMKSKPKNLEKFGNYAKNIIKGIANNVQSSLMEPAALGDPVWGDFPSPSMPVQKPEETKNDDQDSDGEEYEDDEDENQDDDEENEGEEDDDEDEDDEDSEEDEEKGYEEDEGSLDEEQDKQETPQEPSHSDDNFAIDDDEPEPIQHPNPDSKGEISEENKAAGEALEKAKAKKTKKGKGKKKSKKEKAKRKKRREPKPSEGVVLEDVFVNKRYVWDAPFTDFHQLYFKGDYLDFDADEFFRIELVNEKGGLTNVTNLIFNEKKYIAIQDQIFYFMRLEKIDTYNLGLVLESYPLSRLVRLDKIDKKKRVDLSFYTEDSVGNPNQQREFVLEVKNYAKFVKVIDQHLTRINSSYHILRYNIE